MILRECYKVVCSSGVVIDRYFDESKANAAKADMERNGVGWSAVTYRVELGYVLEWPTERGVLYFDMSPTQIVDA